MTKKKSQKKNTSKSSGRKRKYTPKKKQEVLENQLSLDLEPASAPGTKEIDIDDYQPVIWVPAEPEPAEEAAKPELSKGSADAADSRPDQNYMELGTDKKSSEPETAKTEPKPEQTYLPAQPETVEVGFDDRNSEGSGAEGFDDKIERSSGRTAKIFGISPVRIAGAAFIGVLALMFVLNLVTKDVLYSDQENRVFQQLPKFSIGNYLSGRFESQLDNYVSDQFAGRNAFIKIKSAADLTMGQIKANGVYKANDNYLIEDVTYPDEDGVKADIKALKAFKKKYKNKKMYFMLVPNAANILSDKLPSGVVTRDQNKDIDRILTEVKKMGYKPIDVRKQLTRASSKMQVYYRTDHHWTTDGAYVAYKKAAKVMKLKSKTEYEPVVVKKDFIGTLYSKSGFTNGLKDAITIYLPKGDKHLNSVIRYKDKQEKTTMYYDMANLDIKDAYTVFGGTNQSLITISTPVRKGKHLLVVKDSYANCFIPFLTQDYRTITIVDPRYYYENIETVIKADEIDEVLFLYNANTFFSDNYMRMMLTNK